MYMKYRIGVVVLGALSGALIGYFLKANAGLFFGVIYGVLLGEVIALSLVVRAKKKIQ